MATRLGDHGPHWRSFRSRRCRSTIRALLKGLNVRIFAEDATPGNGRHFYIAGHPDLPSCSSLDGWRGVDILSHGHLVFLPGALRPKYKGDGYEIIFEDIEKLADGGDPDGAEAFADWVAERRGNQEQFDVAPPWQGAEPDARQAAYLKNMLTGMLGDLSAMGKDSGRNTAVYNAAMKCGNFIAGAGLNELAARTVLLEASRQNGLVRDDGERSVKASIASGIKNGKAKPRAVPYPKEGRFDEWLRSQAQKFSTNGSTSGQSAAPAPPLPADRENDFWTSRPVLEHLRKFARARRVGPWAMLGCVLVRVVANTTTRVVIPPLAGGEVSLDLFAGIVAFTGGGKGTAESAARAAIDLPHVSVVGPGSGDGIGHLFKAWNNQDKVYVQYRTRVIISAAEVSTLNALKGRSSSTLFRS
jgi:hypothetical protein